MQPEIHYELMIDSAMRDVVAAVLRFVVTNGMPSGHSFYISFNTQAQGVHLSDKQKKHYPEEITIVLQHQFEHLTVTKEKFSVTLHFDGIAEEIIVPFSALTSFADPYAKFTLQFAEAAPPLAPESSQDKYHSDNNVIALDSFRKRDS